MSGVGRIDLLGALSLSLLALLGTRHAVLALSRHDDLRTQAERRRRRAEVLSARRGQLVDRHGNPYALDLQVEDVAVWLPDLDPALDLVVPVARALSISRAEALLRLRVARREALGGGDEPFLWVGHLPLAELARVERIVRRSAALQLEDEGGQLQLGVAREPLVAPEATVRLLARVIGRPADELQAELDLAVDAIHAEDDREVRLALWQRPHVVLAAAPFAVTSEVTERALQLPGVEVVRRFARRYPRGDSAAHVLGTLGLPTPEEARRDRAAGLLLDGDREYLGLLLGERDRLPERARLREQPYGRSGLEGLLEERLAGRPGIRVVGRDVHNRVREVLLDLPPRDGEDVRLTLDARVQTAAEQALDAAVAAQGDPQAGGAAVLIDLRDGGLLALASSPRFVLDRFAADFEAHRADPRQPFNHRAAQAFAPGSTWKVLTAFALHDPEHPAGLAPGWQTTCSGFLHDGVLRFRCDGIHGATGLEKALTYSCNVYFFRGADRLGLAALADWGGRWGLGERLTRTVPGERRGLIAAPDFKERRAEAARAALASWADRLHRAALRADPVALDLARRHTDRAAWWLRSCEQDLAITPGTARNAVIGQDGVEATPIQVAQLAAVVASGGRTPRPRLVADEPVVVDEVPLDPEVLRRVRAGLRGCVTRGTASRASIGLRGLDVAGKTGTAERGGDRPHLGWFMGYYPASAPEVAFAVLVDRTPGHGGEVCGPVARALLAAYEDARGGRLR